MKWISLFIVSLFFVVGIPFVGRAQVNFNINVPPPPGPPPAQEAAPDQEFASEVPAPLQFAAPPDMVVIPSGSAEVYLVPGTVGLYFYGGSWYRFHRGSWFRSAVYDGGWAPADISDVPADVAVVPPDYILAVPRDYQRIHYGDFQSNWNDWDRDQHWHQEPWFKAHNEHHWGGRELNKPPVGRGKGDTFGTRDKGDRFGTRDKGGKTGEKMGPPRKPGGDKGAGGKVGPISKPVHGTKTGPGGRPGGGTSGAAPKVMTGGGHAGGSPGGAVHGGVRPAGPAPGGGGHAGGSPGGAVHGGGHPAKHN
jgi:hypothetical protein